MTDSLDYDVVEGLMRSHYGATVVTKDKSFLMKAISMFLLIITFGGMRNFMTGFVTTIGKTVYVPSDWASRPPQGRAITLRHEMKHLEQERRLGGLLYKFLYVFVFLPGGLAYYRAKFEKEGYAETMRGSAQAYGVDVLKSDKFKANIIGHFISAEYFWMWPFKKSMERWYDATATSIVEELRNSARVS